MVVPAWCEPFTRLQYADKGRGPVAFDCWGFVRHVQRERFGVDDLPDLSDEYASAEDHASVAEVVSRYERALALSWHPVAIGAPAYRSSLAGWGDPRPGDIVIVQIAGLPWHCGVAVGGDWMMHILKGVNVGLEHFTREPWRNRIEGFYRHE